MVAAVGRLISFSAIQTYSECPHKYYLAYVLELKPLRREEYEFGHLVHQVIKTYYELIPSALTPREVRMYLAQAAKRAGLDPTSRLYLLENFASFEERRLSWNVSAKPLAVEREFEKPPLHGVVDALFVNVKGERIVVDWKTSLRQSAGNWEAYRLQGNIYMYLTDARRAIFYGLSKGNMMEFEYEEEYLRKRVEEFLRSLREKRFERRAGEHCYTCEYNIHCYTRMWGFEVVEL
jgi:CRISPR/Cas system-associated exonuclease Cas4 (RecB family)